MKKLILIAVTLVAGAAFAYSQGTISISTTAAEVYTNNGSGGFGPATGANSWNFEVLDMTQSQWNSLTVQQQAGAANLLFNQTDISLWTDSTVSGVNSSLHAGGITSGGSVAAQGWAAPTGLTYSTGTIDYYTIVGWSANAGPWSTISSELAAGALNLGYFGQTAVAYNYAGGGPGGLAAVNLFATTAQTQLAGSGGLPAVDAITLISITIPEPASLALAGLGGLSMLFLRRRKS